MNKASVSGFKRKSRVTCVWNVSVLVCIETAPPSGSTTVTHIGTPLHTGFLGN